LQISLSLQVYRPDDLRLDTILATSPHCGDHADIFRSYSRARHGFNDACQGPSSLWFDDDESSIRDLFKKLGLQLRSESDALALVSDFVGLTSPLGAPVARAIGLG
jgi:hypothetical protein